MFRTVCDEATPASLRLSGWSGENDGRRQTQGMESNIGHVLTFRIGSPGNLSTIMSENPARSSVSQGGLDALNSLYPFTGYYDFESIIERSLSSKSIACESETDQKVLVDVGGGSGAFLAQLLEDHPNLPPSHTVLQDLPHAINRARHNPKLPAGVRLQTHDFFSEQPIRYARAYHIRCLHNYNDELCTRILKHVANAMASQSKLLISENILPDGATHALVSNLDMTTLLYGGKIRSMSQLRALLAGVHLKLDRAHYAYGSTWCMIESSQV